MCITGYAKKLNDITPDGLKIPTDKLLKVCFLHQLGKAIKFTVNENEYEVKKGKFYTFYKDLPSLKLGEQSVYFCVDHGIELSIDEYETILSIDKEDDQNKYHSSILSKILKTAIIFAESERVYNFEIMLKDK